MSKLNQFSPAIKEREPVFRSGPSLSEASRDFIWLSCDWPGCQKRKLDLTFDDSVCFDADV